MYVLTCSQMEIARDEQDFAGFERAYFRKRNAELDYIEAPKRFVHMRSDEGRKGKKFTVVFHAETGMQIGVLDGHH